MGTVAYMSPEQAQGKPADARSDIFSFGLVLYEMLSGRQAFAGDSAIDTMAAIMRDEPAPLDAPANLSEIVTRCLRKSPASAIPDHGRSPHGAGTNCRGERAMKSIRPSPSCPSQHERGQRERVLQRRLWPRKS